MAKLLTDLMCYQLFHVVKLNNEQVDERMRRFELSRTQWKVIVRFNFLPNPCSQQALLHAIGIDRAHLTRTLDQLEKRELVNRLPMPGNRRAMQVELTISGKQLLKKMEVVMQQGNDQLLNGFTATERKQLERYVKRLASNISGEV